MIGVQQDGGTVATQLAQALGWHAVEGAGGVGIISAYPLEADAAPQAAGALPAVGAKADVLGQDLRLWSAGPDRAGYGPEAACQGGVTDPAALVAAEKGTDRFGQAQELAAAGARDVPAAGTIPVIVLADLQSPSGAGWTAAASGEHCGVGQVAWPVPAQLDAAGLNDSFRVANPDAAKAPGNTWSPIVATHPGTGTPEPQDRIDYIHVAGDSLKVRGSNTLVAGWPSSKNIPGNSWASNHRPVVSTFSLGTPVPPKPAPVVTLAKANIALRVGSTTTADELLSAVGASSTTEGATFQLDLGSADFTPPGSYTVQVTATDPATGQVSQPVGVVVQIVPGITVSLAHPAAALTLAQCHQHRTARGRPGQHGIGCGPAPHHGGTVPAAGSPGARSTSGDGPASRAASTFPWTINCRRLRCSELLRRAWPRLTRKAVRIRCRRVTNRPSVRLGCPASAQRPGCAAGG
ncbi:MAG: hypothetical protein ABIN10_08185 [Specibacter sp.]